MNAPTLPRPALRAPDVRPSALLQIARLDLTLLWRNRTALFTVTGLPLMFAGLMNVSHGRTVEGVDAGLLEGAGHLAFFSIFAVFMNLVNVLVARREDLTLKRLRGTSLSDAEILGGSVLTATLVYLVQAAVVLVLMVAVLGGPLPANPPLLLAGMLAGAMVFALLAFVLAAFTPTADLAQLTVLPVMFLCMGAAGVVFPITMLPEWAQQAAHWLPLTPVVEITRTAYFGLDFYASGSHAPVGFAESWATVGRSFAVLAVWAALARYAAGRWFRWEPRRG